MLARLLLDTHILVRWIADARRLSREQHRALESAVRRAEPVALSAISLIEIAMLVSEGKMEGPIDSFFDELQANPLFQLLPVTCEVASEFALLGVRLRDPADRVIVATARVHRLRLVTSDQRIIDSKLAPVVE